MIRPARLSDVPAIKDLIDVHASRELMLSRNLADLYAMVRDFLVYDQAGRIFGCTALHVMDGELGEIRSLAVADEAKGKHIGAQLIQAALDEARRLGLKRVFALTYVAGFFSKMGFHRLDDKSALPHKVWTECINCPKFPECDEEAFIVELEPK